MLASYELQVKRILRRPVQVLAIFGIIFIISLSLYGLLGFSYFPQTDAGQYWNLELFVVNGVLRRP
jgi:multidrug efflux pump subunit AcrB